MQNGHIDHDCIVQMAQNPTQMKYLGILFQIQKEKVAETKGVNYACKPWAKSKG